MVSITTIQEFAQSHGCAARLSKYALHLASASGVALVSAIVCGSALAAPIASDGPPVLSETLAGGLPLCEPHNADHKQQRDRSIQTIVVEKAMQSGAVPPELALAVARVESNFDADALSSKGARGVMQIMPKTARDEFDVTANALWDPEINVQLGVSYLAELYEQYGQRWDAALSHYNGGTLKGDPHNAAPHSYTLEYIEKVRQFQKQYEKEPKVQKLIATYSGDAPARFAQSGPFSSEASQVAAKIALAQPNRRFLPDTIEDHSSYTAQTPSERLANDIDVVRGRFRQSLERYSRRRR